MESNRPDKRQNPSTGSEAASSDAKPNSPPASKGSPQKRSPEPASDASTAEPVLKKSTAADEKPESFESRASTPSHRSKGKRRQPSPDKPESIEPQKRPGGSPTYPPLRDAGRALEEAGRGAMDLIKWLQQATPAGPLIGPEISVGTINELAASANERARERAAADKLLHQDGRFAQAVRNTTAFNDVYFPEEYRKALRLLSPSSDGPPTLDTIRNVLTTLKLQISSLGRDDGQPDGPDLDFVKKKANEDIDSLIKSIGSTAYDKIGMDRAKIRKDSPNARFIIVTTVAGDVQARRAFRAGGEPATFSKTCSAPN